MNVEIAQRLAELRREKGYSQEELAEQLGLSRQAVSKWERAESSPDTGNLVALARLYGVTLDELLRFDEDIEDDIKYEAQDRTKSAEMKAQDAAEKASVAAAQAAAAAAQAQAAQTAVRAAQSQQPAASPYYAVPSQPQSASAGQGPQAGTVPPPPTGAPVPPYAGAPAMPQDPADYPMGSKQWEDAYVDREMRNAMGDINDGARRRGAWSSFPYPVLCVIVFLLSGFFWGNWHPAWIVFLTIPLYYYIAHVIENDPNNRR